MALAATDNAVRTAAKGRYTFTGRRGLALIVGSKTRTFYLKYKGPDGVHRTKRLDEWDPEQFGVEDAWTAALALRRRINADGTYLDTADPEKLPTFGEAFETFCKERIEDGRANENTVETYHRTVRVHLSKLIPVPMDRISTTLAKATLKDIAKRSQSSALASRRIISAVYRSASAEHPSLTNPVGDGKVYLKPLKERTPVSDAAELWAEIQDIADPVLKAAWQFGMLTGIRAGNIRSLTWDQIDFDGKTVHLHRMKNGLARTMPLSDAVIDLLDDLGRHTTKATAVEDPGELVFPSTRGSVDGQWNKFVSLKSGRFHDTRKHFSDAAMRARLHRHEWLFLRGDKMNEQMMDAYIHSGAGSDLPNMVANELMRMVRV